MQKAKSIGQNKLRLAIYSVLSIAFISAMSMSLKNETMEGNAEKKTAATIIAVAEKKK